MPLVSEGMCSDTLAAYAVSFCVYAGWLESYVSAVSNRSATVRSKPGLVTFTVAVRVVDTFAAPASRYAKYDPSYGVIAGAKRARAST